jgi:predicted flap endonuclease-1-like 5' DNA nuclease
MLKILTLFLFFAFRKKEKPQQSEPLGYVPLWGWIFVSAIAALGIVLVLQKKRSAKRLSARRPQVAPSPPPPPAVEQSPSEPQLEPAPPTSESPPEPDNLTKISGIGPKIQQALNEEGIYTYQQLAATSIEDLQALMKRRKWHMSTYTTWPEQAQELAEGGKSEIGRLGD